MDTSNYIVACSFSFFGHFSDAKSADIVTAAVGHKDVVEVPETDWTTVFIDIVFIFLEVVDALDLVLRY
jgi:NifU-like protein involved in Fe-S cluster formation